MKFSALVLVFITSLGFLAFGCVQQPAKPTPTEIASPTEIVSPTIEASPAEIPSPSLQPSPTTLPTTLPKNLSKTEFVSLCNSYPTSEEKQQCLQTAALKFSDSSLCSEIKNFDQRVLCSGLASLDSNKCNQISDLEVRNDCYKLVAIASRDESLCAKTVIYSLFDIFVKMDCLASIAFYKSETKICETGFIGELAHFKPVCFALATKNEKECEKTSDEVVKSDCFRSLAIALLDGNYCLRINDAAKRAVCFSRVTQAQYLRG